MSKHVSNHSNEQGEHIIAYGFCTWWDSLDKVGRLTNGLPCCPVCNSVLFQIPEAEWFRQVEEYEAKKLPGYRNFIEWLRGKCYPSYPVAFAAYEAEVTE